MTRAGSVYLAAFLAIGFSSLWAAEPDGAAERGRIALTTRAFNPAPWTFKTYENVWKLWEPALKEPPADYDRVYREHYGLHPAPYENGRYPMGVRVGTFPLIGGKGLTNDCLLCHGGSILGKSYVGLGNASLDIQAFFADMGKAAGGGRTRFGFSHVRGTSEAGAIAVYLLAFREPDLSLRLSPLDLGLPDALVEDTPAWWLLKKKKTMYHTGTSHARSVRSIMQFMLSPTNSAATFAKEETTFKDIQAYLLSLEAPKYPFPIDQDLAATGRQLFNKTCSQCHGTYGEKWTYPNKIVAIDVIGTDRNRLQGFSAKAGAHYNKTWFAREKGEAGYKVTEPVGYQAPPLDGIWATAPYFHNGSVPTLAEVLYSKARPKIFTRSFKTGSEDYDTIKVGWKIQVLDRSPSSDLPAFQRRQVYDTNQPGRGNQGHTFGDDLTDEQRRAVIEYLKTL